MITIKVIVGKIQGFCNGVNVTIEKVTELLKFNKKMYCLGELVHNESVISKLEKNGLVIINNIEEARNNSTVIFRAHGEAKEVYQKAYEKQVEVIDLTCGKVKAIHIKVEKEQQDAFIIVIGKPTHPEIIGTISYANGHGIVINSLEEVENAFLEFEKSNRKKVYICSQTTYSYNKFEEIVKRIKEKFIDAELIIDNTICNATTSRQQEVDDLSKTVDSLIVIGGKNSSNTKELYNIAIKNCQNVFIIQEPKDIDKLDFSTYETVAVVSGASTPISIVEEITKKLEAI